MPLQPSPSDVHVDRALTDLSVRYSQANEGRFIANTVFPTVRSQARSDKYFTYDRSYWLRTEAKKRAPATESAGIGYAISTDSFLCEVYAVHKDVDDQTRANADSPITVDRDATDIVTEHLLMQQEQEWMSNFFGGSIWGTTKTGGTDFAKWSDYGTSDPIRDVRAGKTAILKSTGYMPNTLVLGHNVWDYLQDHPDFLDRIKYTERGMVGTSLLASLFDIDKVVVSSAIKNTSQEGVTASYSFTAGDHALLMYVAPSAGLNRPSAGYTFRWSGFIGSGGNGIRIKRFRMEEIESDRVEGEAAYDQKLVAADLGYFWATAV